MKAILVATASLLTLGSVPAFAAVEEVVVPPPPTNNELQLGAGVNTYRTGLDASTDSGTSFDLRLVFGARQPLGLEAAYAGALNDLKTSTGGTDSLMMNSGEALLRLNLGGEGGAIQPYLAGGIGVASLSVVDKNSLSSVNSGEFGNSTDITVPAAAGIDAFIGNSVSIGARVGYRYFFHDQVKANASAADAQAWNASARLGVAF